MNIPPPDASLLSSPEEAAFTHQAPSVLTFVAADLMIFAMLFIGFMVERHGQLAVFNESAAALNPWLGILNLIILVSSGLCVVLAINSAKAASQRQTQNWLAAAFIIGAGFGVSKVMEYSQKLSHDITMHTNDFYMFYYALTGAHFIHFVGGMLAIAFMWFKAGREPLNDSYYSGLESVGIYWHMVDLLWIFIFPLLYLVGLF